MTRTLPLVTLDDGEVQRLPTQKPKSRAPVYTPDPTPETLARAKALLDKLSPGGVVAATRFIEMLARDEGVVG